MTNAEIIKANKRSVPFRANEKVQHVIAEHRSGVKEIYWVSAAPSRKDQLITFKDDKSNAVSAYFYQFAEPVSSEEEESMSTVGDAKEKCDYFWVFVPKYDAWRLGRYIGPAGVVLGQGGLWVIHPDISEDWPAVGIEQPRHPRAVTIPKSAQGDTRADAAIRRCANG